MKNQHKVGNPPLKMGQNPWHYIKESCHLKDHFSEAFSSNFERFGAYPAAYYYIS